MLFPVPCRVLSGSPLLSLARTQMGAGWVEGLLHVGGVAASPTPGIAGLASLSAAGTRKLTSMGPLRFFGGLAAMGGAVGLMVDFTTRAGYEDAFMDAGETPPHETPWFIKPNKTFARAQATSPQCDCQGFF